MKIGFTIAGLTAAGLHYLPTVMVVVIALVVGWAAVYAARPSADLRSLQAHQQLRQRHRAPGINR